MARSASIGHAVRMRLTTRRILATTISAAVLVGACSSGDDDADSTTTAAPTTTGAPETTAAPETTTTTEAPPTTPAPPTAPTTEPAPTTTEPGPTTTEPGPTTTNPPPTTNPGDPDWAEIAQGLYDLIAELWAEPDVERINELCFPGENTCRTQQGEEIQMLADEGWRVINVPQPEVIKATVVNRNDSAGPVDIVTIQVELTQSDFSDSAIVDKDGNVVQQLDTNDGETYLANIQLIEDIDGRWKATGFAIVSE